MWISKERYEAMQRLTQSNERDANLIRSIAFSLETQSLLMSDLRNNNDELESVIFTVSDACSSCPNNPKNGGSGICHCILGLTPIT